LKSISLNKYKKYLKSKNCYKDRTVSSHEIWYSKDIKLTRPIIVDSNYSDVPVFHIKNTLKLLGISDKDFEKEIRNT